MRDGLQDDILHFTDFDKSYFPHADSLVEYLSYYEQLAPLNIQYNTTVHDIQKIEESSGTPFQTGTENGYFRVRTDLASHACRAEGNPECASESFSSMTSCRHVIVTTGFHKAYVPFPATHDPDHVVEHYESVTLNVSSQWFTVWLALLLCVQPGFVKDVFFQE